MRELSHNSMFHTLLGSEFGPSLLRQIASVAAQATSEGATAWRDLAAVPLIIRTREMNRASGSGRADEVVKGETAMGVPFAAVFEIKVRAGGGEEQLHHYVAAERAKTVLVAGCLLHIPGRDMKPPTRFPLVTGCSYRAELERARHATTDLDPRIRWLLDDYVDTLRCLDDLDVAIAEHGQELKDALNSAVLEDADLKQWADEHWRWIQVRLLREVELRFGEVDGWRAQGVKTDANGAALNMCTVERRKFAHGSATRGASAFLKWRQEVGLEVHVIVDDYSSERSDDARDCLNRFWPVVRGVMHDAWAGTCQLGTTRGKNSRMAARLPPPQPFRFYDARAIVRFIYEQLPVVNRALEEAARKAAEAL